MPKNNTEIGQRIKKIRKGLGINQTEFGGQFGLTSVAISRYERGRIPNGELLEKIARLGHVTVDWLLTGKETYSEEKEKITFFKEGSYLSTEEKEVVALLRENPEVLPLLRKYGALKTEVSELAIQIVLSPKTT